MSLTQQSQALNDLSGGLKISEFIMQQAETNALSDKINGLQMYTIYLKI